MQWLYLILARIRYFCLRSIPLNMQPAMLRFCMVHEHQKSLSHSCSLVKVTPMMKRTLRIALTPFMLIARLVLGLAAFISSIASAVIGLAVGLFAVLSVIEFAIGYWQNGIAFMVLALLASPIGLPAVANFLLNRMDHILGFFEGLLC